MHRDIFRSRCYRLFYAACKLLWRFPFQPCNQIDIYDKTGLQTTNDRPSWGGRDKLDVTPTYYKLIFIKKVSSSFL